MFFKSKKKKPSFMPKRPTSLGSAYVNIKYISWGAKNQAIPNTGPVSTPLIDLQDYLKLKYDTWYDLGTNMELLFFGSEISADPQISPLWAKMAITES